MPLAFICVLVHVCASTVYGLATTSTMLQTMQVLERSQQSASHMSDVDGSEGTLGNTYDMFSLPSIGGTGSLS